LTTIDPSNPIALALRAQLAAVREQGRAKAGAAARDRPAELGRTTGALAQGIAAIAPDDPDRRRKAVRVFLQAEILREFGQSLLNDPQFGTMLDAVQEQMGQDEKTAAAVSALGDLLLAGQLR
jgi:hypothetical protein